jgi:hypothetical protein
MSFLLQVNLPLGRIYLKLNNISLWGNLVKHYVPPCKKEAIINTVKRSHYVRGSESREPAKEPAYIYCYIVSPCV